MKRTIVTLASCLFLGSLVWAGCSAEAEHQDAPEAVPNAAEAPTRAIAPVADVSDADFTALDQALDANPNDPELLARAERLNAATDQKMGLVATIDVEPGHTVKLYEPSPGTTAVGEFRKMNQDSVLDDANAGSLVSVFESLQPGVEVPEALLDAEARHGTPSSAMPVPSTESGSEVLEEKDGDEDTGPVDKHATSDCQHFKDHGACPGNGDYNVCLCRRTNDLKKWYDSRRSRHITGSYDGSVTMRVHTGGGSSYSYAVPEGFIAGVRLDSPWGFGNDYCECGLWQACGSQWCVRTHYGEVVDATNNGYHYGGCYSRSGNVCL